MLRYRNKLNVDKGYEEIKERQRATVKKHRKKSEGENRLSAAERKMWAAQKLYECVFGTI
jgi:hypothetical protein